MGRTRALAATLLATLAVLLQTASADYYDEYNDSKGLSGTDFDAVLEKEGELGIHKKILEKSEKCKAKPSKGDTVSFYYRGWALDGEEFDKTPKAEDGSLKPSKAKIGSKRLFPGVELALKSMCVGEKAAFRIPPELAFNVKTSSGNQRFSDKQLPVPRESILEYEIELVALQPFVKPNVILVLGGAGLVVGGIAYLFLRIGKKPDEPEKTE